MIYLPAILALAAALFGIRGAAKWDDKQPGIPWWRRITIAGWLAALLALMSATASIVDAQKAAETKRELVKQQQLSKRLAFGQLREALGVLVNPLVFLMSSDCRSDDLVRVVDCALREDFLTRLEAISVMARPDPLFLPRVSSWAEFIGVSANRADDKLESVLVQFRSELDEKTLNGVEALRKSGQLTILMSLPSMVVLNQQQGVDPRRMTLRMALLGPREPDYDYVPFLRNVRSLLVEADTALKK
jgi:hypothetical protein